MLIKSFKIDKTKASAINLFFNYGAAIIQIINSIILIPLYLNYMTLSDYGAWIAGCAILNLITVIDPGLSSISSQRMSESYAKDDDKEFNSIFKSSLLFSIFFSVSILLIGFALITYVPALINYEESIESQALPEAFLIYIFSVSVVPLSSVLSSSLQALLRTFEDNMINFISILTSPVIIIISLINGLGIVSLALGILVPNLLRLIGSVFLALFFFKKYIERKFYQQGLIRLDSLLRDIKFLYLRRFSTITSENIEYLVSGIFLSTEISGSISIIKRLFISVQLFSISIGTSTYTSLAHKFSESSIEDLAAVLRKTIYSFQLIHFTGSSMVIAAISPILSLWLGTDLLFSYFIIIFFAVNVYANANVNLFSSILYSSGNYEKVAYISLFEGILRIILSFVLLSYLEVFGLIIAGIVSASISVFLQSSLISKMIKKSRSYTFAVSTKYEVLIYGAAVILGYFNSSSQGIFELIVQIILSTAIISLFLLFSREARNLIKEISSKFINRGNSVG